MLLLLFPNVLTGLSKLWLHADLHLRSHFRHPFRFLWHGGNERRGGVAELAVAQWDGNGLVSIKVSDGI